MSEQQLSITCSAKTCAAAPGDFDLYNLQNASILNAEPISILAQCPTDYYCAPGTFPKVFTYAAGTFSVIVPPSNTGFPIVIMIHGCESDLNTILPAGSSEADISAAAAVLITAAAEQQARCDAIAQAGPLLPTA